MHTKRDYLDSLQCRKRAWLAAHRPELAPALTVTERQQLEQGTAVGAAARRRFPGGLLMAAAGDAALRATEDALRAGAPILFEAAFRAGGLSIRCDVLVADGAGAWTVIEVKAAGQVKTEHLHDLAVQVYVLELCGLAVRAACLMHINTRDCRYPDLDNLFVTRDVTAQVRKLACEVAGGVADLQTVTTTEVEPTVAIGAHCETPNDCPFMGYCWQGVPQVSIFDIPGLKPAVKTRLAAQGILDLADLPPDLKLTKRQQAFVALMRCGATDIDRPGLVAYLERLHYPIYFFDFEADAPAVPRFAGLKPYQAMPFQYSCHILEEDGTLAHREYLHTDAGDPRLPLAEALLEHVGPHGSVVVYHAQFERTVLHELAAHLPEHAARLHGVARRLWDQLEVFRRYYRSAAFLGSNSIKYVLPALAPHLSYNDLAVQRGDQAQAIWQEMIACADAGRKAEMASHLRAYCARDTYAMVEIHRVLEKVVDEGT